MIEKNINHVVRENKEDKKDNFLVLILFFLFLLLDIFYSWFTHVAPLNSGLFNCVCVGNLCRMLHSF
jgi:hypothetical protein